VQAIPQELFAAPAGTSGNLAIGGHDPERGRAYVMYLFTGGGYGGSLRSDGISNGCSTIGISKMPPIEVMEQYYPVLFEEFALNEGSGGAGEQRGGFGVNYAIRLQRGAARASMVMDHGRTGPIGALGGSDGGLNQVAVERPQGIYRPPHLSKDQDIELAPGDVVRVSTPGGGGYGDPLRRDPAKVAQDFSRGYYTRAQAEALYGVALDAAGAVDSGRTEQLRSQRRSLAA
jgi:N-methylhydantoinase B